MFSTCIGAQEDRITSKFDPPHEALLYPINKRFNHSCLANCWVGPCGDESENHRRVIFTTQRVAAGEELTIDYLQQGTHEWTRKPWQSKTL